ncbi:MAG: aldehyde dehydrogenase family protein [Acidimicrobiia bacterium]|nr:aldehyde dehydrogenase family protein [Acidimicrobiia bacterium]
MTVTQTTSNEATTPGGDLESRNPATGELLGKVPVMGQAEVDTAVARAREAARTWGAMSHAERRRHLTAFRRELGRRVEDMGDLIHRENGKPVLDSVQEVLVSCIHLDHATLRAEKALATQRVKTGLMANVRATISYHPLGVIGVIGPWNYPLFTPMGSIGYALAAGNTVVFKPSELTPLVGRLLEEIAADSLPDRYILQTVTGDGRTGGALAASAVDKLAFTGSAGTGRKVMAAAAANLTPVVMELGGKDPMIVAADADAKEAAKYAVYGALTNAGQACVSVERCYVVGDQYDEFVQTATEAASKVKVGGDDGQIGAITRPQQVDIIRDHLEDAVAKGAKVLTGGPEKISGNFVEPTVLVDVTDDMRIMTDETFGPVLPVIRVDSADEAIERANDTEFGLGSSVFGEAGIVEMAERIKSGMTAVNSVMTFSAIPTLPFGGIGESGFGRIHGDEGLKEFSRTKAIAHQKFSIPGVTMEFAPDQKSATKLVKVLTKQAFGGGIVDRLQEKVRNLLG